MLKSDFGSDISRNSNSSFSKTAALKFCIEFFIDAFILLHDFYTEEFLVLLF